jgi:hypothetical protein
VKRLRAACSPVSFDTSEHTRPIAVESSARQWQASRQALEYAGRNRAHRVGFFTVADNARLLRLSSVNVLRLRADEQMCSF